MEDAKEMKQIDKEIDYLSHTVKGYKDLVNVLIEILHPVMMPLESDVVDAIRSGEGMIDYGLCPIATQIQNIKFEVGSISDLFRMVLHKIEL